MAISPTSKTLEEPGPFRCLLGGIFVWLIPLKERKWKAIKDPQV